jgi:hypothetical protein
MVTSDEYLDYLIKREELLDGLIQLEIDNTKTILRLASQLQELYSDIKQDSAADKVAQDIVQQALNRVIHTQRVVMEETHYYSVKSFLDESG